MEERKTIFEDTEETDKIAECEEAACELRQEALEQAAGGFFGVPTVPVNPIDDELREDV